MRSCLRPCLLLPRHVALTCTHISYTHALLLFGFFSGLFWLWTATSTNMICHPLYSTTTRSTTHTRHRVMRTITRSINATHPLLFTLWISVEAARGTAQRPQVPWKGYEMVSTSLRLLSTDVLSLRNTVVLTSPPPAVVPNSAWSRYTDRGTARTVLEPIHSQGPSHFAGRLDYDRDVHGISRSDATPSPSSHDSRGPMLASKGLLCRDGMGPNTGVSNFVQFNRLHDNLDSTFQQESCQCTGVPSPLTPNPGPTPQGFLEK